MRLATGLLLLLSALSARVAPALDISNRYRSPRNPERKVRASTRLIVLHTTEAPARSSLNKVSERGECHFCVTEEGFVYAIVDRDREAFHAGRSMWNGVEDVDKISVGIECVGYHDKPMPAVQIAAIRDLVAELKRMYRVTDDRVVCHSHVAYGMPNRWQKRRHRGRKRCGMLFAMPSVRRQLGLRLRPGGDTDVAAGRLSVGDDYLRTVLYGRTDTMARHYAGTAAAAPSVAKAPVVEPSVVTVPVVKPSVAKPPVARPAPKPKTVIAAKPAENRRAVVVAKKATTSSPHIVKTPTTVAQLKTGGWKMVGTIRKNVTAMKLAGRKWNAATTYYVIRGKLTPGNRIDPARIEVGMTVWVKLRDASRR